MPSWYPEPYGLTDLPEPLRGGLAECLGAVRLQGDQVLNHLVYLFDDDDHLRAGSARRSGAIWLSVATTCPTIGARRQTDTTAGSPPR